MTIEDLAENIGVDQSNLQQYLRLSEAQVKAIKILSKKNTPEQIASKKKLSLAQVVYCIAGVKQREMI